MEQVTLAPTIQPTSSEEDRAPIHSTTGAPCEQSESEQRAGALTTHPRPNGDGKLSSALLS